MVYMFSRYVLWSKASDQSAQHNLPCSSKNWGVISAKALLMLARMPLGGSLVTLTLFWRTLTGKCLAGMELRKSRKSSWISSGFSDISFTMFSMANIQDAARWQFCRNTQSPVLTAARISFSATGPWPWPREMDCTLQGQSQNCLMNIGPSLVLPDVSLYTLVIPCDVLNLLFHWISKPLGSVNITFECRWTTIFTSKK